MFLREILEALCVIFIDRGVYGSDPVISFVYRLSGDRLCSDRHNIRAVFQWNEQMLTYWTLKVHKCWSSNNRD